jgi:hypothetical protein
MQSLPARTVAFIGFASNHWVWIVAGTALLGILYKYKKYRDLAKQEAADMQSVRAKRLKRFENPQEPARDIEMGEEEESEEEENDVALPGKRPGTRAAISNKSMQIAVRMLNGYKPSRGKGAEFAAFFAVIPLLVQA